MKKQKKVKKETITKDMIIAEIVQKHPKIVETLFRNGLFCVGCHQAASETLEQACQVHGINVNKLLKQLNKVQTQKIKLKREK